MTSEESTRGARLRNRFQKDDILCKMMSVLRSATSIGLAVWMAMLACLAGCGQMLAKSRVSVESASNQQMAPEMPACHRSHSSTPSPQKKQDSGSVSCCPPDAISQKSTPTTPPFCATEAPVPSTGFQILHGAHSLASVPTHPRSHRSRDTLLETHLLRI